MKSVVVYYSLEGNTRQAAQKIAQALQCNIIEIKPKKPLDPNSDNKFVKGGMQATFGMKPAIENISTDMSQYDQVILGFPVWAGKCAPYINTFLKKTKTNAKINAVFTLSGGGDNEGCIKKIKKKLPNLATEVALADRTNEISENNDEKIEEFIVKIR